jgi:hypothetical protein
MIDWSRPIRVKGDNRPAEVISDDYMRDANGNPIVAVHVLPPLGTSGTILYNRDGSYYGHVPGPNQTISMGSRAGSAVEIENIEEIRYLQIGHSMAVYRNDDRGYEDDAVLKLALDPVSKRIKSVSVARNFGELSSGQ